jgi:hypothetical protein
MDPVWDDTEHSTENVLCQQILTVSESCANIPNEDSEVGRIPSKHVIIGA